MSNLLIKCITQFHRSCYTVPNCAKRTLQGIIRGKVKLDSVIHSDYWRGYNGLVDIGYKNIIGYTMVTMNLQPEKAILMELNPFGLLLKEGLLNFMEYPN